MAPLCGVAPALSGRVRTLHAAGDTLPRNTAAQAVGGFDEGQILHGLPQSSFFLFFFFLRPGAAHGTRGETRLHPTRRREGGPNEPTRGGVRGRGAEQALFVLGCRIYHRAKATWSGEKYKSYYKFTNI